MNANLFHKLQVKLATLLVAGGTAFAVLPTDGCNSTIKIAIEDGTGLVDDGGYVDDTGLTGPWIEPVDSGWGVVDDGGYGQNSGFGSGYNGGWGSFAGAWAGSYPLY